MLGNEASLDIAILPGGAQTASAPSQFHLPLLAGGITVQYIQREAGQCVSQRAPR